MEDTRPDEPKSLLELKAKKKTAASAPAPGAGPSTHAEDTAMGGFGTGALTNVLGGALGGAAAAAGVLTAVDEDDDGEEAPVPDEFEVEEDEAEE